MKIVCTGSFCAGALITDLLNGTKSPFEVSVVQNRFNHILKVPLEGNNPNNIPWILLPTHTDEWLELTEDLCDRSWTEGKWFAHHQPAWIIPNLDLFEDVIHITTESMKSRWLRFLRHYYIEINGQRMIQDVHLSNILGMMNIVKHDPSWLEVPNVTNVEFEDIVSGKWCEENGFDMSHMKDWQNRNKWLADDFFHDPALVEYWEEAEPTWEDPQSHGESWEALTVERINGQIQC